MSRGGEVKKLTKSELVTCLEDIMYIVMDDDNVWDLERANEIRNTVREYSKKAIAHANGKHHVIKDEDFVPL